MGWNLRKGDCPNANDKGRIGFVIIASALFMNGLNVSNLAEVRMTWRSERAAGCCSRHQASTGRVTRQDCCEGFRGSRK
jgi:hypothetical protein